MIKQHTIPFGLFWSYSHLLNEINKRTEDKEIKIQFLISLSFLEHFLLIFLSDQQKFSSHFELNDALNLLMDYYIPELYSGRLGINYCYYFRGVSKSMFLSSERFNGKFCSKNRILTLNTTERFERKLKGTSCLMSQVKYDDPEYLRMKSIYLSKKAYFKELLDSIIYLKKNSSSSLF
ncbi:hypothetical protein BpHYR1_014897 [Brachionus plicatilis]|uniref:Uncharacterized protein n=1 Tax=Brachionus plicatilis TaxID=10195 RepID=A0A3M7R9E8_BRAPC|nr:hypothetical protein BpHYR1_014897 [Brachionus plicatilis]